MQNFRAHEIDRTNRENSVSELNCEKYNLSLGYGFSD